MITTDAALFGAGGSGAATGTATGLLDDERLPLAVCSCGQDLGGVSRRHCPRCGCCLN